MEFDPHCTDGIPNTVRGFHHIYCSPDKRESVFNPLESELLTNPDDASHEVDSEEVHRIDPSTGRPGMDLWSILVFGVTRQVLECD